MKGLLQSKRFKRNLKKWLFMYVGAILMLTTVVTYSKYISQFGGNESARVTRFNVVIDKPASFSNSCSENSKSSCCTGSIINEDLYCTTENFRPTQEITYEFVIRPDFEVNTTLYTNIYVLDEFEILKLQDDEDNVIYSNGITTDGYEVIVRNIDENENGNTIKRQKMLITNKLSSSLNNLKKEITYKITLKYKYNEQEYKNIVTSNKNINLKVIKVGYSAIQNKN